MDNLTPITREEMIMNDEPLTPITREEKILAGEDLNPVTRREYFLKKYRHAGGDVMVEGLEVTANGTYTAPEGKAYSPVEVAVPLPENAYLLKTASGSLVSFSDGADLPMPSFICNIDAVQDLHGYDAPWVGGAGKNKLQVTATTATKSEVTFTVKEDGTIVVTGTKSSSSSTRIWFDIAVNISFPNDVILNGCPSDGGATTYKMAGFLGDTGTGDYNDIGSGVTIPANTMLKTLSIGIAQQGNINLVFKPMIRLASVADATFAPYSNICPISGWDEANVSVCGKNLIPSITEGVELASQTGTTRPNVDWYVADYSRVEYGKTYYVSGTSSATVCYYDRYKNFIRNTLSRRTITPQEGECYVRVNSLISGYAEPQIEEGNEATSFSPIGQTYTIDLNGTRYGGKVDVVSGVLTVNRRYFKYINISTTSGVAVTDGWRCNFTCPTDDINRGKWSIQTGATPIFNKISVVAKGYGADEYTVTLPNVTSKQEADAMLEGLEICYKLITPITIQLTPTQVKSLLGNNNAWCDTGDVDIDYFAKEVTG